MSAADRLQHSANRAEPWTDSNKAGPRCQMWQRRFDWQTPAVALDSKNILAGALQLKRNVALKRKEKEKKKCKPSMQISVTNFFEVSEYSFA